MEFRDEERIWVEELLPVKHRTLLILAVAVLLLSAVALALNCIDAALETSSDFRRHEDGWSVGTMVFMLADSAVYLPGVLFGLAALGLAQSETTRGRAEEMARFLFVPGGLVVIAGVGYATCAVGSDWGSAGDSAWSVAHEVLRYLGRSLIQAGTLVGLAYLCRQRVGSAQPCETNKVD